MFCIVRIVDRYNEEITSIIAGLNKDFKKMLTDNADLKALSIKDILTASDGTRKEAADIIHFG